MAPGVGRLPARCGDRKTAKNSKNEHGPEEVRVPCSVLDILTSLLQNS